MQGKNNTLHCKEAALCRFTRASYFYRKHQNTSHSKCSSTVYNPLTLPDGLFVVGEGRKGIPPKHKPRCLWDRLLGHVPGNTHSPPVLEHSVFFRTDFAIISGTCFCGSKNQRESLVYCCQQFPCTKKNILICTFSLAW